MGWVSEHGRQFRVPMAILEHVRAGTLRDLSWHNDMCPSFGVTRADGTERANVWVDHPQPLERECAGSMRFCVSVYDESGDPLGGVYEGDDVEDALRALFQAIYGNEWDGRIDVHGDVAWA